MTAFYKDVFDLAGVRVVHALPQPYSEYYNVEYARIPGIRGDDVQGAQPVLVKLYRLYLPDRQGNGLDRHVSVPALDAAGA